MKPHLFRKQTRPARYGIGQETYLDYRTGDNILLIGNTYGEGCEVDLKDIDRLIEVLQEIKDAVKS